MDPLWLHQPPPKSLSEANPVGLLAPRAIPHMGLVRGKPRLPEANALRGIIGHTKRINV